MVSPLVLVVIAGIMVGTIVVLIRGYMGVQNLLQARLILFGVAMMVAMFVGAGVYVAYPSGLSLAYVVGANMLVMVVGLVFILSGLDALEGKKMNRRVYNQYFTALVLLNEASMGFVFVEAQSGTHWLYTSPTKILPASIVSSSVNTYWFFLPMFFEMASAIYFSRVTTKDVYYGLLGAALFSPSSFSNHYWSLGSLLVLIGLTAYFTNRCLRSRGCGEGIYYLLALTATAGISFVVGYWLLYAIMSLLAINWFFTNVLSKGGAKTS